MTISIDPRAFGSPLVTWSALFALAGVALLLGLLLKQAPARGISRSELYAIAVRGVLWGLIGARLFHVLDYWTYYVQVPFQVFYIWNGGFAAWGAILVGGGAGLWHARRQGILIHWITGDLAVAGLGALALFRLGDFLTAQRLGTPTSLPWGVVYTYPAAPAFLPQTVQHPIALYELVLVSGLLAFLLVGSAVRLSAVDRNRLAVALMGYGLIRFLTGFAGTAPLHLALQQDQWIGLAVAAAVGWHLWRAPAQRSQRTRGDVRGKLRLGLGQASLRLGRPRGSPPPSRYEYARHGKR